jgi:hypothetical protein
MKRIALFSALAGGFLAVSILLAGCVSAEEYAQAQADSERLTKAIEARDADLAELTAQLEVAVNADDAPTVTELVNTINGIVTANSEDNAKLAEALGTMDKNDKGWAWAEAIAGGVTTMLGVGGIGGAAVGRMRGRYQSAVATASTLADETVADFNGLIAAITAGGGPMDKQATRDAMKHYPGLKDRVTNRRGEIGDKVRTTVKPPETP